MKSRMFVCAALTILAAIGVASADEVFTATMVRTKGLSKQSVHLDLRITEYATQEDADALQKILAEEGQEAMQKALRAGDRGVARVTGGLPRKVNWVRVFPGQNGSTVIIVTEHPLYFPGEEPESGPSGALGFITLEMNDRGHGRGRLAEVTAIHVTEDNVLKIEASRPAVIEMEDVRRVQ